MTTPDRTTPDPASPPPTTDGGVLDAGTYPDVVEPRSPNRLPAEPGVWHRISRRYLRVLLITTGGALVIVVAVAVAVAAVIAQPWPLIAGAAAAAALLVNAAILPRRVRSIGYLLREDDLVLRRGILFQRMIAVPYGRMQLIDVSHGPLDRAFGIAQLTFVTAAAAGAVKIPGLDQRAAQALRDRLVAVAEHRRTGL
ncbi:PH domain-containing protein [Microbacterium sp.]|uniref:PH domain-containing protein n=1 Tax=Microbacterium sp. TaxID=51671 RepID=UPI0039E46D83